MNFASILAGATVFLDANTLVYHFSAHPTYGPPSATLLDRIEKLDCQGATSTHLLSEMMHKLMTIEAQNHSVGPPPGSPTASVVIPRKCNNFRAIAGPSTKFALSAFMLS
jgi:predicted nucleic acid-binding protein